MVLNREIRVNSHREKKALASLSLALSVLGLSLDDLTRVGEIAEENRRLRASNENLTKRLDAATGGKPVTKDDPSVLAYMKGITTITRPGDSEGGTDA